MKNHKKEILIEFNELEAQLRNVSLKVNSLQQKMISLIQENDRLNLENKQLLKLNKEEKKNSSNSLKKLDELYAAGFHICREQYGEHREPDEQCIFCLELLDNIKKNN